MEDFRPRWCYAHGWDCPEGRCPSNCAGLSLWNLNDSVTLWALCEPHPAVLVGQTNFLGEIEAYLAIYAIRRFPPNQWKNMKNKHVRVWQCWLQTHFGQFGHKVSSRARTEADRNRAFDLTQCVVADVTNAAAWLAPFWSSDPWVGVVWHTVRALSRINFVVFSQLVGLELPRGVASIFFVPCKIEYRNHSKYH
jgi:hypothetical protein